MICQIERLYKALAPQILACLRSAIGATLPHLRHTVEKRWEPLQRLSSVIHVAGHCMVRDGPHPGATINIQVGSSLTKGGGGQTKNLGKLLDGLNIYQTVRTFPLTIVVVSWKTSGK